MEPEEPSKVVGKQYVANRGRIVRCGVAGMGQPGAVRVRNWLNPRSKVMGARANPGVTNAAVLRNNRQPSVEPYQKW